MLINGRDQVAGDTGNQGFRSEEQIFWVEGLVANAGGDVQLRKEVGPGDLHVEPGSRQLALGLADVGSVLKQLRGHSDAQRVNVQIEESPRTVAFDRLREAIDEEVDTVLDLDDVLLDDQLFALVLANLGLETLDSQLGAAGGFLLGLGDLRLCS